MPHAKCLCLGSHLVASYKANVCRGAQVYACMPVGRGGAEAEVGMRYSTCAPSGSCWRGAGEREGDRVHLYTPLTIEPHPAAIVLPDACTCRSFGRFTLLPRPVAGRGRGRGGVAFGVRRVLFVVSVWHLAAGACGSCAVCMTVRMTACVVAVWPLYDDRRVASCVAGGGVWAVCVAVCGLLGGVRGGWARPCGGVVV
jgi:hypothetical protein